MNRLPSGDRLREMLDEGAAAMTEGVGSMGDDDAGTEADALAVGGEGAAELEAATPILETLKPISEAERDALRGRQAFMRGIDKISNRIAGPDGQMISGHYR